MARIPLKLEEMIDSAALRSKLDALAGKADPKSRRNADQGAGPLQGDAR